MCSFFSSPLGTTKRCLFHSLTITADMLKCLQCSPKARVMDTFEKYVVEMKYYFGDKCLIGKLRCDNNGTEYINARLERFCQKEGILIEPCPAYVIAN